MLELADALDLDQFSVLGGSGGGPYAVACAAAVPNRLFRVGLVSSAAPPEASTVGMHRMNRFLVAVLRYAPWIARGLFRLSATALRRDPGLIERMASSYPAVDREALSRPGVAETLAAAQLEAVRGGTTGPVKDGRLLVRPWNVPFGELSADVYLWHGERDVNASPEAGRYLAEAIPNCTATFFPEEGHVSTILNHADEIMAALRIRDDEE